jgi:hypothetical protein
MEFAPRRATERHGRCFVVGFPTERSFESPAFVESHFSQPSIVLVVASTSEVSSLSPPGFATVHFCLQTNLTADALNEPVDVLTRNDSMEMLLAGTSVER